MYLFLSHKTYKLRCLLYRLTFLLVLIWKRPIQFSTKNSNIKTQVFLFHLNNFLNCKIILGKFPRVEDYLLEWHTVHEWCRKSSSIMWFVLFSQLFHENVFGSFELYLICLNGWEKIWNPNQSRRLLELDKSSSFLVLWSDLPVVRIPKFC